MPWDSQNPEVRKFFENNEENKLLDKIISREIDQIEKDVIKKQKKKRQVQFSEFYNFMFELTKRMKIKMKENKKNYKFRKISHNKHKHSQSPMKLLRKRGRPKKVSLIEQSSMHGEQRRKRDQEEEKGEEPKTHEDTYM